MLIIGAKGHAKEILEILYKKNETENLYFYDDISEDVGNSLYGKFPIIKTEDAVKKYFSEIDSRFHLGMGSPLLRKKMYDKFSELGGQFITLISNHTDIGSFDVQIAEGCTIASGVTITNSITIDKGCLINRNTSIGHDCNIGKFVELCPGVILSGNCSVGDFSFLGTGVIVIPQIKIGKNVVVAAGAVVTNNIPDNVMVVGIPAVIKKIEQRCDMKLSIVTITYNHANYIRQTLDSIFMQNVNVDYEVIVANDGSSDGTHEIIQEFINTHPKGSLIRYIHHQKNIGMMPNFIDALKQCKGKYIALCEGDDYWIDPLKLQKQVDFIEANPNYVICGTDAKLYIEQNNKIADETLLNNLEERDFDQEDIATKNRLITATVLFRNVSILKELPKWFASSPFGDWPLYIFLTKYGRAKNLNFVSAVYRQHSNGVFSGAGNFKNNYNHVVVYKNIIQHFNIKSNNLLQYYLQYIFFVYCDTKEKVIKKEMILNYMYPFRFSVFFDKTFLSMVKRYLLN